MTDRSIIIHPEAILEAREAAVWYNLRSPAAAEAFVRELDEIILRIQVKPLARREYLQGTRRCFFHRFPFAVVYRVTDQSVQIIAIAHARRRPGYWKKRSE